MCEARLRRIGREIHRAAVEWLRSQGYEVPENILELMMKYFGVRDEEVFFEVVALGGETPDAPFHDKVAHEIHEVVEVSEIYKRYGFIGDFSVMRGMGAYDYAHPIAKCWEQKFLRSLKDG